MFHVNVVTASRVGTIFVYKGLTRNLKIRNTPVWALPNIWRLGLVRDTKFGTNVSDEKFFNDAQSVKLKIRVKVCVKSKTIFIFFLIL